jgi:hypothetical protein
MASLLSDLLLPCPFCGTAGDALGTATTPQISFGNASGEHSGPSIVTVLCMECGACGPVVSTQHPALIRPEAQAVALWNQRSKR